MNTYMKIIPIGILMVLVISSCSDDFLTLGPKDTLTEQNFYQNEDDAQSALTAVYNRLTQQSTWGNVHNSAYIEWGITGDTYEMDRSQARIELHSLRFPSSNAHLRELYTDNYVGISRANTVIAEVSKMEDEIIDTYIRDVIVAQAQYLRGMFYYNLVSHFGGVPLIREALDASSDFAIPRATREETWSQVIQDFKDAAEVLPPEWNGDDVGRASKTSAFAFLVKSYLHQENWDQVINYSELIFDTKQHDLIMSGYRDVFREENDNNMEILFSTQFSGTEPGRSNILSTRSAPRGAPGIFTAGSAWSNYVPNTNWVNAHETNGDGDIIDQRYHETVIGPGDKHQDVDYSLDDPPTEGMTFTGYILTKYWFGKTQFEGGSNAPNVRLPEIMLAYAEALNEKEDQQGAMIQVNKIRGRAGLDSKPLTLSYDEVLDAIFHEYRFEFMWEPTGGFSALNRRGRFLDFLEENHLEYESLNVNSKPWLQAEPILFPIPDAAYEFNKALEQNPHYPSF